MNARFFKVVHNGWCYGAACVAPAASCIIARVISWLRIINDKLKLNENINSL